ncbi:se31 [Alphabaculovirus alterspexiguae]|uniref:Se31 n=1 Tax=Spodoptera exigua multiple nucleopolyhedrovirus TaxID=10454 RepID=A0A3G2JTS4_9ABAC|nr:se31 [Spodoptera exigua multiple nucleopolyhedrovirus]AYN44991.1 se31 [Spodoptera exigua multiple nucleopolyhedrovirus]
MERFELIGDLITWNQCRVDKFAACYFRASRSESMKIMLISRLVSATITATLIAVAIFDAVNLRDFALYYTHWSLATLLIMFTCGAITSLVVAQQFYNNLYHIPGYVVLHRILYNIACTTNILSSIGYFIVIYTYGNGAKPVNYVIHTLNSLLVIVEITLNAIPMKLFHVFQPLAYTLFYGIFIATYHYFTGETVYKCLKWHDQQDMSKLCIAFLTLMFVIYIVLYTISFIKNKCLNL